MMLKLKLQYFGHLMRRVDSLEKTLMLGLVTLEILGTLKLQSGGSQEVVTPRPAQGPNPREAVRP